jgi:hypothetical protein
MMTSTTAHPEIADLILPVDEPITFRDLMGRR